MKNKIICSLIVVLSICFSEIVIAQDQVLNYLASEKIFSLLPDDGYESVNFSNKSIIFLKVKQIGLSDQIMIIETNLKDSTEIMCAIDEEGNLVAGNTGCGSFNEHVFFNFGGMKSPPVSEEIISKYVKKAQTLLMLLYSTKALGKTYN